jgi:predicted nuclease of predicted toxin-antitoxin system
VRHLRIGGDDVVYAAEVLVGASDEQVLKTALEQDRVVLTFDRDFGEMVFHQRLPAPAGIVLFPLHQQPPEATLSFLQAFFDSQPILRKMFTVSSHGQFRQIALG